VLFRSCRQTAFLIVAIQVVCHKTLNHAFGDMDLKRKFEFVLKTKGAFRCPGT
jgi:hypothetical protein